MARTKHNLDQPPCLLCKAPAYATSRVCIECHNRLRAENKCWCNRGRHIVSIRQFCLHNRICNDCRAVCRRRPRARPKYGYIHINDLARTLYISKETLRKYIKKGWPVEHATWPSGLWIRREPEYPPFPPRKVYERGRRL